MDQQAICEAQARICREQAGAQDGDRAYWLAEASRWQSLARNYAHPAAAVGDEGPVPRVRTIGPHNSGDRPHR
jgi:hypothetical protein